MNFKKIVTNLLFPIVSMNFYVFIESNANKNMCTSNQIK